MSNVNTITQLGDKALMARCGNRTITGEFYDDIITNLGNAGTANTCSPFIRQLSMTGVSLPNLIKMVGNSSKNAGFAYCVNLKNVSLPSLTSVEYQYGGFNGCTSLEEINLPSLTSTLLYMFEGCTSLHSVSLPKVKSLARYTFKDCTALTEISLPGVTSLSSDAFTGCTNLQKATFAGVTTLTGSNNWNTKIFNNCPGLSEVCFPNLTAYSTNNQTGGLLGNTAGITDILPHMFPLLTTISGNYGCQGTPNLRRFILFALTSHYDYRSFHECRNKLRIYRAPNAGIGSETFSLVGNQSWPVLRLLDFRTISDNTIPANFLQTPTNLSVMIIRKKDGIVGLASASGRFVTQSKLKSGGAGMDIYVPADLVSAYEEDTNWSVLGSNGYGTARFHAIEGSAYENIDYDFDTMMED